MLPNQAIEPATLLLLKELQALPSLQGFYLVGGTALALRYQHRLSIDLDLFSNEQHDFNVMKGALEAHFGKDFFFEGTVKRIGIFAFIRNVKVDLVYYPHPLLEPIINFEDIMTYSDADIAAMKVAAMLGRGRRKDFFDLALLINLYGLEQIIEWYRRKFPSQMLLISIPEAITYFSDAEESDDPVSLKGQTWEGVKKIISRAVRDYLS